MSAIAGCVDSIRPNPSTLFEDKIMYRTWDQIMLRIERLEKSAEELRELLYDLDIDSEEYLMTEHALVQVEAELYEATA